MASARREKKEPEDNAPGMAVFAGLAAAVGFGVAAGYGIKKFVDYLSEEKAEQPMCSSESCSGGASGYTSARCFEIDDSPSGYEQELKAAEVGKGSAFPAAESSVTNLHDQLQSYHKDYACIDRFQLEEALADVSEVKDMVRSLFEEEFDLGDFIDYGSTPEGLKVISPDQFDIMIPFHLEPTLWTVRESDTPGCCLVKRNHTDLPDQSSDQLFEYAVNGFLSPAKLQRDFQSKLQANHWTGKFNIQSSSHGPTMTLTVRHGRKVLSMNFVLAVVLGDKLLVAKPWASTDDEQGWMRSYANEERDVLNRFPDSACHRTVLRIMKAVRLNNCTQLGRGKLCSYAYKTILLHMMGDDEEEEEWQTSALAERFIDMLLRLRTYVDERCLPHYFAPEVNLLAGLSESYLDEVKNYITSVVDKKAYDRLLQRNCP